MGGIYGLWRPPEVQSPSPTMGFPDHNTSVGKCWESPSYLVKMSGDSVQARQTATADTDIFSKGPNVELLTQILPKLQKRDSNWKSAREIWERTGLGLGRHLFPAKVLVPLLRPSLMQLASAGRC